MFHKPLFPMHSNIYLLPHWVVDNMKRRDIPIGQILDFPNLRRSISVNDLLSIVSIQSFGEMVVGSKEIIAGACSVFCEWISSCSSDEDRNYFKRNIEPFEKDPMTREGVCSRLFQQDPNVSQPKQGYEIIVLNDKAIGIVIYPGYFHSNTEKTTHFEVIRALLKQLYVYEEQSVVANQSIFRKYLDHLMAIPA